jgi:hypothetical protein
MKLSKEAAKINGTPYCRTYALFLAETNLDETKLDEPSKIQCKILRQSQFKIARVQGCFK